MRRPRRSSRRIAALRRTLSGAGTKRAAARRTAGNADVLLAVDGEGNRWPQLRSVEIQIDELLAGIRAETHQPVIHAAEHQIPRRRQTPAGKRARAGSGRAPAFLSRDRIPRVQDVASLAIRTDDGQRFGLRRGWRFLGLSVGL